MLDNYTEFQDSEIIEDSATVSKLNDIISNIEILSNEYLKDINSESITEISQLQYNGLLMYINLKYINPTKCLYKYYPSISHDHRKTMLYDDDLIYMLCEYYIYISQKYNKTCNPQGFSYLTGISLQTMNRWESVGAQRPRAYEIVKMLQSCYENTLEIGAQTGKNPVGYIASLNHRFKWSADSKPQLTVNITRTQDDILRTLDTGLIEQTTENPLK